MSRLSDLRHRLVQRECDADPKLFPLTVMEDVLAELQLDLAANNDAVCLVLARSLYGGTIAELAPSCWVNCVPNGEGVSYRDFCRASRRSGRPINAHASRWEPDAFLARDATGTLASRADAFKTALTRRILDKLTL